MFVVPDAIPENIIKMPWLKPYFADEQGNTIVSIHALVIETSDKCIIVDTCLGNDKERHIPAWNNLQTKFLEDLERAGYKTTDIDTVLCTHLHTDHVGWNTKLDNGRWVPTFPNANYLFHEKEYAYWEEEHKAQDWARDAFHDSVLPVVEAGKATMVKGDHEIDAGLWQDHTTAHTPGALCLHAENNGEHVIY